MPKLKVGRQSAKVGLATLRVRLHSQVTWLPVGGANLTVLQDENDARFECCYVECRDRSLDMDYLVGVLKGFDEAQCLVDITTDSVVIHFHMTDLALWIDNEQPSVSDQAHVNASRQDALPAVALHRYLNAAPNMSSLISSTKTP